MTRGALDAEMRGLLIAIATCSHVPAVTYGGGAGSDEHPGGRRPPGDLGAEYLARRYGEPFHTCTRNCRHHRAAASDLERWQAIVEARDELKLIRGTGIRLRSDSEEDTTKTISRMLNETAGWAPEDVERSRFRMSARMVRRHRSRAGLNPETGRDDSTTAAGEPRDERAAAMFAKGMTTRQIAAVLDVDQSTIVRDLRRAAA